MTWNTFSEKNVTLNATYEETIMASNQTNVTTYAQSLADLNTRYATALIPFTVILGIFCVTGIVGNIMVFVVYGFGQKFKDKKFRYYVLTLAVIDFVTCLTLIPAEMVKHMSYFNFTEHLVCKMKCFFNVFAASSASYCLTLIAVDRFIMICHPLFFAKVPAFSNGLAKRLCLLMIVLAIVTAIPSAILCGITSHDISDVNGHVITVYLCESDPYYESKASRYVYRFILCITQSLISLVMIVLYAKIGHAVMRVFKLREVKENEAEAMTGHDFQRHYHNNFTEQSDENQYRQNQHHHHMPSNIKLLFLVTVVFIVTYLFYMVLSWVDQTTLTPTQFLFFSMAFRMYFIHSIINPILYMKMDKYFRKRCLHLLRATFRCRN